MWKLAQEAPAIWSRELLQQLNQSAWLPKVEQDRVVFEKLKQLSNKTSSVAALINCHELFHHSHSVYARSTIAALINFHQWFCYEISFSHDGQLLASCSNDETIRLWQMPDGRLLRALTGHTDTVEDMQFSPDGQLFASYDHDRTIKLWQMPNGQLLNTLIGHTDSITDIQFSPDGQLLASCGGETIKLWQMPNGQLLNTLTDHNDWRRRSSSKISFSPDGQLLASCSYDHTIKLWRTAIYLPIESAICLPIEQLCKQKIEWVKKRLQGYEISKEERDWLEFMQGLMDWYRRFDVEVEDEPQLVGTGEFDIEIEG